VDGALQLRPGAADDAESTVAWGSRHYRGALAFAATDSALLILNVVDVEEYLRGVVPLEIGARRSDEHAAVEAQAVAARSFTYERMAANVARPYDLTARESDQVYGGADVETLLGSLAVDATAGVLLTFAGRPVNAPYHSACGGSTADPSEVWRERGASYLRGVSDLVPGTSRAWCDISPRSRWERTYTAIALREAINRYLGAYATVPPGDLGEVRDIAIEGNTPSGRVAALTLALDGGRFRLRGNDIRYVLRSVGGEILPSTYFSLEPVRASGRLAQLIVRGRGNGHGVGMCQWGAIGRARAGADFRAILRAYFPGTELARAS
jgi:stage II sporulation protein D